MKNIETLKKENFSDALDNAILVRNSEHIEIGSLIPIGNWAIFDDHLLSSFAEWRSKFMRFFLTQFQGSVESTRNYLLNIALSQNNRVLFALYEDKELVGHLGLCNITRNEAELDNFIRGKHTNNNDLIYFAEKAMLTWAFDLLGIERIYARCLSINTAALSLHRRFGFYLKKRHCLKKVINEHSFSFEVSSEDELTEKFYLDIIEVTKNKFNKTL